MGKDIEYYRSIGETSELFIYEDLIDTRGKRVCITYCSSTVCAGRNMGRYGKLISNSQHLDVCPNCSGTMSLIHAERKVRDIV